MSAEVALVSGGTGFLGQSVVKRFLEEGYTVVVPWIVEGEVARLRDHVGETDRLHLVQASVTEVEGAQATVDAAVAQGRLRVVAALVGGFDMAPVAETSPESWDRLVSLNATSLVRLVGAAVPRLREDGGGAVVSVAAEPALQRGAPGMGAYAATKAAVVSLTQTLAVEEASHGITANAVAPRIIDTPANRAAMPDADTSTWLSPEEIAGVISFLASKAGASVTGNTLTLSRG